MEFHPGLVIAVALLVAGIRYPGILLGGVFFTYQLGAVSSSPWLGSAYIAVATIISVVRFNLAPHRLTLAPADIGVVLIVALSAMSIYWSIQPDSSVAEALALFLSVAGMYGVARLSRSDGGQTIRTMLWTIVTVAPLASLLLLSQRATMGWNAQRRLLLDDSTASAVGISQPFAASLLACSMLLLMRVANWQKALALVALLVVAYTAIASGTRSVFLAYAFGLLVFFLLSLRSLQPSRLLQAGLAVVIGVSVLSFFAPVDTLSRSAERILGTTEAVGADASSLQRLAYFDIALDQFQRNPLQGMGDGGLLRFAAASYPHNLMLEILSEFGLLGALVFGFWFLALFREAGYVRSREPEVGAILIAFLALTLMQHQVSYSIAMGRSLFLVCALLAAYGTSHRLAALQRRPIKRRRAVSPQRQRRPVSGRRRLARAGL